MARDRALATPRGVDTALADTEAAASSQAIDLFVTALGGRDALTDALVIAHDAPEVDRVVTLLLDPRYAAWSLRRICALANLTIVDLFAAYKSAMISRAHLQAYQTISAKLLPVIDDVMTRAAPYQVPCERCDGTGTQTDPKKPDADPVRCGQCRGVGQVLQLPDLDRQKLALELGALVQKGGGITVTQNTNTLVQKDPGASVGGASLVDLQQAVRTVLSGPRTPIAPDAEPHAPAAPLEAEILSEAP